VIACKFIGQAQPVNKKQKRAMVQLFAPNNNNKRTTKVVLFYGGNDERICGRHLCRIAKTETSACESITSDRFELEQIQERLVLDFLHARKVSPLNLWFKPAQFPRYPNFASLNTYGNPPNSHRRILPLSHKLKYR